MEDNFVVNKRICIVFELLGYDLCKLMDIYEDGLPDNIVKRITKQLLYGLSELHNNYGIIHTDLKLENILITQIPSNIKKYLEEIYKLNFVEKWNNYDNKKSGKKRKISFSKFKKKCENEFRLILHNIDFDDDDDEIDLENLNIKIIDLGNALDDDDLFSDEIQTRYYRSPEVLLGYDFNHTTDIWSLGCIIYELLTGQILFDPRKSRDLDRNQNHLLDIIELFGDIPENLIKKSKRKKNFYDNENKIIGYDELELTNLSNVLQEFDISESKSTEIESFLKPMFMYDIDNRSSANNLLQSSWLTI